MGIVRVQKPKLPVYEDKTIVCRSWGSRDRAERRMHFWTWYCSECGRGQYRMFSQRDAREAVVLHRLARHPEWFSGRS